MRLQYNDVARDGNGIIISSATVSVFLAGTSTAANIYTTSTSTTAVNSVTTGTDGSYTFFVDALEYGSYQTYKLNISSSGFTSVTIDNVVVDNVVLGTYAISTAKVVSYPVKVPYGVTYSKSGTGTITFNAALDAGLYQIFSGFSAGNIVFGNKSVQEVYPEWWGAGNSVADNTTAIQCALSSFTSSGGIVALSACSFDFSSTLNVPSYVSLKGIGDKSLLRYKGSTIAIQAVTASNFTWYSTLESFHLTNVTNPLVAGTVGIDLIRAQHVLIYRVNIDYFAKEIQLDGTTSGSTTGCYNNVINECDLNFGTYGVYLTGVSTHQNSIIGGRIRKMLTRWVQMGTSGNDVSSVNIDKVNFVDIGNDGTSQASGIGVEVYGQANSIMNNRFENGSNWTGTQTYINLPAGSYSNHIISNDFVAGFIDNLITDDAGNDNIIIDRNSGININLSQRLGPVDYYFGSINTYAFRMGLRVSTNNVLKPWIWRDFTNNKDLAWLSAAGVFSGYGFSGNNTASNALGTITVNMNLSTTHTRTLTGDVSGVAISNAKDGQVLVLEWIQGGTGSYVISGWDSNVKLIGGAFTPTAAVGARDVQTFWYNGTNWIETSRGVDVK